MAALCRASMRSTMARCGATWGPPTRTPSLCRGLQTKLAASWGEQASWTQDSATHPGEAHALKLDASKAGACLGWLPVLPLKPALEWIVEWYRAFQNGDDLRRLTEAQIERYESLLQN